MFDFAELKDRSSVLKELKAVRTRLHEIRECVEEDDCSCDCGHEPDFHNEDCKVCLPCRVLNIMNRRDK